VTALEAADPRRLADPDAEQYSSTSRVLALRRDRDDRFIRRRKSAVQRGSGARAHPKWRSAARQWRTCTSEVVQCSAAGAHVDKGGRHRRPSSRHTAPSSHRNGSSSRVTDPWRAECQRRC
jgi:hypothetical protein